MATSKTSNPDTTSERVKGELFAYCETVRSQIDLYGFDGEKLFDEFDADMEDWFKARIPPSVAAPVLMRRQLGMRIPTEAHEPIWKVEKVLTPSHDLGETHVWTLPLAESECSDVIDGIDEILHKQGTDELEVHQKDGTYFHFDKTYQFTDDDLPEDAEEIIDITPSAYSI